MIIRYTNTTNSDRSVHPRHRRYRLLAPVAALGAFALMALLFQWLWNITLPAITGLPVITFFQSAALMALLRLVGLYVRTRRILKHPRFSRQGGRLGVHGMCDFPPRCSA